MMGDFNSKIGNYTTASLNMGKYAMGDTNENGNRLVEFAEQNDLKITS